MIDSKFLREFKSRTRQLVRFIIQKEWLLAIVLTIFIVVIGSIISVGNNKIAKLNPVSVSRYVSEPSNKLSYLANWDGVDYISISKDSYTSLFLTGFFPFFPMLLKVVNYVITSPLISGIILSWSFMAGASFYYLKLVKLLYKTKDNLEALRATLFFVLFPSAVYLMAIYTESLFAFLALGAIYYALKKKYLLAGILTSVASATHIRGAFLLILITLILIEEKEKIQDVITTFLIGSFGLLSFMIYLLIHFHNPLAFISAQKDHGWLTQSLVSHISGFSGTDFIFAIAILITVIYWWKRRKSFAIYSLLYLLIPLIGGQFGGFPRYSLMVFPLQFMVYDCTKDKKLGSHLILIVFSIFWCYILLQFAAGYIVS